MTKKTEIRDLSQEILKLLPLGVISIYGAYYTVEKKAVVDSQPTGWSSMPIDTYSQVWKITPLKEKPAKEVNDYTKLFEKIS